ncbi:MULTISPECIES: hypothetical protein [Pseudomonas]|uniref:hypothetical protein n=1 Tax=Pseudomonas TaxID=286 RepID=UPI0006D4375A|nr:MULTISPECIES: hypothetical protein [Pseudomonas]MCE4068629.1 hypothetical protein [Pseudomonas nitritireducens]MCE4077818.1 hypothetical protein [Pseudomonas nitroreducens]OBY93247.1 hypothetical protein A6723_008795 [Pseudomonas sp. AU11447]
MKPTLPILEISPHQGIGPVCLGDTRAMARDALAAAGFPLESSNGPTDYFCQAAIQAECDEQGLVWFIGISQNERYLARYQGVDVFSLSAGELFSLIASTDDSGAHEFTDSEYLFPGQIITLWDADEQYDRQGNETRPVWAQVGIGNSAYAEAIAAI